ncbi:MAG: hypothetical protein ACX93O_13595 [Flagellimonas sp.]
MYRIKLFWLTLFILSSYSQNHKDKDTQIVTETSAVAVLINHEEQYIERILPYEEFMERYNSKEKKFSRSKPYFALVSSKAGYNLKDLKFEEGFELTLYEGKEHLPDDVEIPGDMFIPGGMFIPGDMFNEVKSLRAGKSEAKVEPQKHGKGTVSLIFF